MLLGRATCVALLQAGHAVDWVTNGNQLIAAINKEEYDCVLLDLGLPGPSGEECLRSLRSRSQHVPVVVLTARGQKDDRIAMLDMGADDYMVKPYDLDEMAARVRAVVRRSRESENNSEYTHGPLQVRPMTRTVLWYGEPVALTSKEFLLLEVLAASSDAHRLPRGAGTCALWLARGDRQQCRRGARAPSAAQALAQADRHDAWRGLSVGRVGPAQRRAGQSRVARALRRLSGLRGRASLHRGARGGGRHEAHLHAQPAKR